MLVLYSYYTRNIYNVVILVRKNLTVSGKCLIFKIKCCLFIKLYLKSAVRKAEGYLINKIYNNLYKNENCLFSKLMLFETNETVLS